MAGMFGARSIPFKPGDIKSPAQKPVPFDPGEDDQGAC
jgi:hypothetical protein